MRLNIQGLSKIIKPFHLVEEKKKVKKNFEKTFYSIISDYYDLFVFPSKIGVLKFKRDLLDKTIEYSGFYEKYSLEFDLPAELKKNLGVPNCRIDYYLEKNELEDDLKIQKNFLQRGPFWIEDKKGIVEKVFPKKNIFN